MCAIRAMLCTMRCHEASTGPPSSTFRTVRADPPLSTWPASAHPILGHLLLCCENNIRAASEIFVCLLFQCNQQSHPRSLETSDDNRAYGRGSFEGIAVSSELHCRCSCGVAFHSPPRPHPHAARVGLREDPNSDLPQEAAEKKSRNEVGGVNRPN